MVKKAEVRLAEDNTLIPHVKMGVEAGNGKLFSKHTKSVIPRFARRLLVAFNLVKVPVVICKKDRQVIMPITIAVSFNLQSSKPCSNIFLNPIADLWRRG